MTTATVAIATMKTAQVPGPGADFQIVEREVPQPGPGQVRIKVQACGVCHSDAFTKDGKIYGLPFDNYSGLLFYNQCQLKEAGFGEITTEIADAGPFYYAEEYHQQYLHKVPNGYCGLAGTGLSCPIGLGVAAGS